jgi:uncharacterized protein YndB with AHSA1/START domain
VRNDTVFLDIVPDERIVFAYSLLEGGARFTVSLGTIVLARAGEGTLLSYTEQGVYFEGSEGVAVHRFGWRGLLEKLARALTSETAADD